MALSRPSLRRVLVAIAVAAFGAVALALVSQHYFHLQPCPWCVLQRLVFVVIGAVALLGAALPAHAARVGAAVVVVLFSLSGIAAALWQHFVAAKSSSCNLTLADKIIGSTLHLDTALPDIFAPRASCAEAAVNLLGIPYVFWSLVLFMVLGIAAIRGVCRAR